MDYILLGKRVRSKRKALGLTQERLAEAIGVSTSFIGHIERGSRKASIDTLVDLANVMNVSADELLCDSLNTSIGTSVSPQLSASQRSLMQEILMTLQNQLDQWSETDEKPAR